MKFNLKIENASPGFLKFWEMNVRKLKINF
jgi:hypothetical protein